MKFEHIIEIMVNVLVLNASCLAKNPRQTVQTKIRLFQEKKTNPGLPCLLFSQAVCEYQPWKPAFHLRTDREMCCWIFVIIEANNQKTGFFCKKRKTWSISGQFLKDKSAVVLDFFLKKLVHQMLEQVLTRCLLSVVCWQTLQTVWTQTRPDRMSCLFWIQTVWQSDGIPERFFLKKLILKKISRQQKRVKNFRIGS